MNTDTLPFAVQLSADRRYLTVRIPVQALPADLRRQPSALNVRLMPEQKQVKQQAWRRWVPDYLLALAR
ncbi:hypothetical protein [Sinimarinibacterium sp. NLF-5-8]|uniref:hypothetical protein n=1 Tax=Sinimarinibacterium sp. NLF-5-8 TaxID=2698684 RepID=UPI00137BA9B5|nr:hypothetical protein [Sinimarinibacterium sp. NLF-5-8]QHS08738.1 hypothetical protein GT972_00345 [Sinimarinibacterium sp. NLF-5-8]